MPYSIIYHSKAKSSFTQTQIEIMLIKAKQFNKVNGITGCIIYSNNQFIQIIEGEKAEIVNLYASIKADDRHYEVSTLIETQSDETLWEKWSMAFYKFTNDAEKDHHNRLLLESYFNRVKDHQKTSKVYTTLKENVLGLLKHI